MNIPLFISVVTYMAAISLLSIYYSKYVKTSEDFLVAGRRLNTVILAGTLIATWMGSGTVVGGTNTYGFNWGPVTAMTIAFTGSPIGILILTLLAKRLRERAGYTIPDLISRYYGDLGRLIACLSIILAYIGITSYQYSGIGFVLNASLGIDVGIATMAACAITIITSIAGGLISVAYTDFIGAVLMLTGLLVGALAALGKLGGWTGLMEMLPPANRGIALSWWQILQYSLPALLLVLGDQNMYQRLFAAKDPKTARAAAIGWLIGTITVVPLVSITGAVGRAVYGTKITAGMATIKVASEVVPIYAGILMLPAITAFIVTTANSYLLSAASNVGWDIYSRFIRKQAGDKEKLIVTRLFVLLFGILAYFLITKWPDILAVQMYSYTMYGAVITPPLLAALLWKKITRVAGLASMAVGAIVTIVWELAGKPYGVGSVLISAPLATITLVITSLITYREK
ncbi:MAG: sodium:solute symporter family protein [Desulfurococcaceae archaeon]